MNQTHFKKLENMYKAAPTNLYYNPTINIGKATAEICFPVKQDFFHSGCAVHGSVYFKALDDAAYFAVNSLIDDYLVVTVSFSLNFIRPITKGLIKAVGNVTQLGKKISFAESIISDERGRVCAKGSGSFIRSDKLLSPEIGYV